MLTLIDLIGADRCDRAAVPGGPKNVQDIYPLSPLQEGMLFHHLLNEQRDTYILSTLFELQSHARLVVDRCVAGGDRRHDILRSAVLWEQLPRPVQVVYRRAMFRYEELELDRDRRSDGTAEGARWPRRPELDLRQAPLGRLQVAADGHGREVVCIAATASSDLDHKSLQIVVAEAMACLEGA